MKFSSEVAGTVTGIRFYKAAANTGAHVGSLWSASGRTAGAGHVHRRERLGLAAGQLLQTGLDQRQHDLCGGLPRAQRALLGNASGFASAVSNPPLSALSNAVSANGVYAYSATSTFPTSTFKATNYWVDVDFTPTPVPGQVTNVSATAGTGVGDRLLERARPKGGPVGEYTVTPYIGSEAQTATTLSGSPPATKAPRSKACTTGPATRFTVQASNGNGAGPGCPRPPMR